jgi:hypothetical protein
MGLRPDPAVRLCDPRPPRSTGQVEPTGQESSEARHLDAGEVAEALIQQRQPEVAGALHQLAHLLQAFDAAGFAEQLQQGRSGVDTVSSGWPPARGASPRPTSSSGAKMWAKRSRTGTTPSSQPGIPLTLARTLQLHLPLTPSHLAAGSACGKASASPSRSTSSCSPCPPGSAASDEG